MTNPMDRREVLGAASFAAAVSVLGSGEAAAEPAGGILNVHVLDLYSGTPRERCEGRSVREGGRADDGGEICADGRGWKVRDAARGRRLPAGRYLSRSTCLTISRPPTRPCRRISFANCRWSSRSPTRPCRTTSHCNARRGRRRSRCCRVDGTLSYSVAGAKNG